LRSRLKKYIYCFKWYKTLAWTKLEVLSVWQGKENDSVGKVSFRASFVQEGKNGVHVEHSRFKRFGKAWMYVDGEENL